MKNYLERLKKVGPALAERIKSGSILPDISVFIPSTTTPSARIDLLRSAGVPLSASGAALRGFMLNRWSPEPSRDKVVLWFDREAELPAAK